MGGEDDGVILAQGADQIADLNDLLGVEAYRRLVENDDLGRADECAGDAHALAVALGQVLDDTTPDVPDAHHLADLTDVSLAGELAALQLVVEVQVLVHRHVQVEGRLLGQVADLLFGVEGIPQHVDARHADPSRRGGEVAREDVHGGGLTRAVGPEEADDLALADGEADVVHGAVGAVVLDQMFDLDHGCFILSCGSPQRAADIVFLLRIPDGDGYP